MTRGTLPIKLVAVLMAIGVVSGFATGSITYAKFSDTEEASVTISAASDWDTGDTQTGGDSSVIPVLDFVVRPDPLPRSKGTFTIDIVLGSSDIDSVSNVSLHITETTETVLHPQKLTHHDSNSSDNRSTIRMKFGTPLLFLYFEELDAVDASVSYTVNGGTEITADGTIDFKKGAEKPASTSSTETKSANGSTLNNRTTGNETRQNDMVLPNASVPKKQNVPAENSTISTNSSDGSPDGNELNQTTNTNETDTNTTNSTETNETLVQETDGGTNTTTDNETTSNKTDDTISGNETDDGNTSDSDGNQTNATDSTGTDNQTDENLSRVEPITPMAIASPWVRGAVKLSISPALVAKIPRNMIEARIERVIEATIR